MAKIKKSVCRIEGCGKEFDNAYELSKHIAAEHSIENDSMDLADPNNPDNDLPPVTIRTTRPVEFCVAGIMRRGTEFEVPYNQADDIKRVLREGYERDGADPILKD